MMIFKALRASILTPLVLISGLPVTAQTRTVALTFDDLPVAATRDLAGAQKDPAEAQSVNRALLDALKKHHAPAIGFVNGKRAEELGSDNGKQILEQWVREGFDLGNHTFSHADLNNITLEQFKQEVVTGEDSFRPMLAEAGKTPRYLRFPYNHTGDTKEKHDSVAVFLKQRGYQVAACTIDNEDYLFNAAYIQMLAKKEDAQAAKLRAAYLAYTAVEIEYYASLHERVFGREIPQVMILHANRLNADVIEKILGIFEEKQYRFTSLEAAQSDPAYRVPDTFVTKFGPMWGYRWAKEFDIKVDGSLETEPPAWIAQYGKGPAKQ
jgi:peptidoglycan/xylan/chitin deacetylase (PgdA/CDA1 family)